MKLQGPKSKLLNQFNAGCKVLVLLAYTVTVSNVDNYICESQEKSSCDIFVGSKDHLRDHVCGHIKGIFLNSSIMYHYMIVP